MTCSILQGVPHLSSCCGSKWSLSPSGAPRMSPRMLDTRCDVRFKFLSITTKMPHCQVSPYLFLWVSAHPEIRGFSCWVCSSHLCSAELSVFTCYQFYCNQYHELICGSVFTKLHMCLLLHASERRSIWEKMECRYFFLGCEDMGWSDSFPIWKWNGLCCLLKEEWRVQCVSIWWL